MSGIKSDRWIRRQCIPSQGQILEGDFKPMIEPYARNQVREIERNGTPAEFEYLTRHKCSSEEHAMTLLRELGVVPTSVRTDPLLGLQIREKIISYGTSSYGYDVRCADEFKVFTNVHSTVVDPKKFDNRNFVDFKGDHCIIPPNSFALARTVEYLRVPRDTLIICLGKSTYARCFSGDTRVALANGSSVSLKDMAKRSASGERFFGYGMTAKLGVVVTEFVKPRLVNRGERLVRVTLDDGATIDCTPDHKFLTRDGRYVPAEDLKSGQSLMPLYREVVRDREMVYNPDYTRGNWWRNATYRLSDAWNIRNGVYAEGRNEHRHHIDEDKRNDYPTNIERKDAALHVSEHNEDYFGDSFDAKAHSRAIKRVLKKKRLDPEWTAYVSSISSEKALKYWGKENAASHAARNAKIKLAWSPRKKTERSKAMKAKWDDPAYRARMQERASRPRTEFDLSLARRLLKQTKSVKETAERLGITPRILAWQLPHEVNVLRAAKGLPPQFPTNHKVVSVVELKGKHDVYCLTSPETGNFALEAGVFVKNCGIIVNVTPLEPEWEGHITLEFSNTTPLPAKVYANEGCAQFLFFQADADDVCETSYKDRGGKYQGQTGITLPRA